MFGYDVKFYGVEFYFYIVDKVILVSVNISDKISLYMFIKENEVGKFVLVFYLVVYK